MMISVLRYRATVHPLKPAIGRAKLRKVCYIVYVVGFIMGMGLTVPECFNVKKNYIYLKSLDGLDLLFLNLVPTTFMFICYCKIRRALVEQNKQMKRTVSAAVRNRHNRDRRIFLVCLCTVLCFAVGRLLRSVSLIWILAGKYYLFHKHVWVLYGGHVLHVAGTVSLNPLIYGILDKRMFRFLNVYRKKRQTPEELAMQEI